MAKYNEKKLSLIWDKRQKDFVTKYPRKCDGGLVLSHLLGDIPRYSWEKEVKQDFPYKEWYNFKKDLEDRGYDLKTLRFEIELKDKLHD